jgi:hypothetical protein
MNERREKGENSEAAIRKTCKQYERRGCIKKTNPDIPKAIPKAMKTHTFRLVKSHSYTGFMYFRMFFIVSFNVNYTGITSQNSEFNNPPPRRPLLSTVILQPLIIS